MWGLLAFAVGYGCFISYNFFLVGPVFSSVLCMCLCLLECRARCICIFHVYIVVFVEHWMPYNEDASINRIAFVIPNTMFAYFLSQNQDTCSYTHDLLIITTKVSIYTFFA